jgi:6-phosphogluconolactonase
MMSENYFYLIGRSSCPRGGIYRFRETQNGMEQCSFHPLRQSNWMTRSPDGKYIYATSRNSPEDQGCAAFRVLENGDLEFLNYETSCGKAPCYTIVSPDGKFLYCANYTSGSFTEFQLEADGRISDRKRVIQHEGCGPNTERQEGPHTHCTEFTPDHRYLIVTDLGADCIKLYPWTPEGIRETEVLTFSVPAGSGPRHLVFNRAGTHAYLLNELGNTVMTLSYTSGSGFELLHTVSTLPEGLSYITKAAAIRLSPDEKYLYASNRGYDTAACYVLDPETGYPVLQGFAASGGDGPRDINYLPGFRKFAMANEFSGVVVFFDVDSDGMLNPDGNLVQIPGPLAIFR